MTIAEGDVFSAPNAIPLAGIALHSLSMLCQPGLKRNKTTQDRNRTSQEAQP
jgi:hypothetical protein